MALGTAEGPPEVYLVRPSSKTLTDRAELAQVDRKEEYYLTLGFAFPHHEDITSVHVNTVIDAELVIDVDPSTGKVCSIWIQERDCCHQLKKTLAGVTANTSTPYVRLDCAGWREPHEEATVI